MKIEFQKEDALIWVKAHEKEMVEDISALVRVPSVAQNGTEKEPYGFECKRVLTEMENIGKRYGFLTKNHGSRCLSLEYGKSTTEICIWGHLDVVPAGDDWLYPPFECSREGDYLIGRGVQDNKGPVIAMLYAMRYLKEKNFEPSIKFKQILGCQEETNMEDIDYYRSHERPPAYSFVTDCGFPVCCGEKGIYRLKISSGNISDRVNDFQGGTAANAVPETAKIVVNGEEISEKGISGHSAFPVGTENAIGKLCKKILQKKDIPEKSIWEFLMRLSGKGYGEQIGINYRDDISGELTCNLGLVRLKNHRLEAEIDIRYPVTEKVENIRKKLEEKMKPVGFSIVKEKDSSPSYISPEHFFVTILMESYREVTQDHSSSAYVMGGGTYARKIPRAVGFGPGLSTNESALKLPMGHGNCHSADESQSMKNLQEAFLIYVHALLNINEYFKRKGDNSV